MEIKVLGTGCKKCKELESNAREAVKEKGIDGKVEKVEDMSAIMEYGVMKTPALVVDGEVKVMGKLLSVEEIISLLP